MISYIPPAIADQFQAEFEKVAELIYRKGRQMALPMEVVLLQIPLASLPQATRDYHDDGGKGGSAAIVAFHTAEHIVAYIDEEDTLVEIDYLATREQAAKR